MRVAKLLLLLIAVGSILTFSGCGDDSGTTESTADQQFTKLAKTWKLTGATLDGDSQFSPTNPNGVYNNSFTVTFNGTKGTASTYTYSVAGRPSLSPWKASGTWAFGTDPVTQITRDPDIAADKLEMTYSVSDPATTLQIQFNFQNPNGGYQGRLSQTKGNWIFTFSSL